MNYQSVDTKANKCSEALQIISVDPGRCVIKVRSTQKDLDRCRHELESEDAKSLALRAAVEKGLSDPSIKHASVQYGDDKQGVVKTDFHHNHKAKVRPFLVVEVMSSSTADMQFPGDSL